MKSDNSDKIVSLQEYNSDMIVSPQEKGKQGIIEIGKRRERDRTPYPGEQIFLERSWQVQWIYLCSYISFLTFTQLSMAILTAYLGVSQLGLRGDQQRNCVIPWECCIAQSWMEILSVAVSHELQKRLWSRSWTPAAKTYLLDIFLSSIIIDNGQPNFYY